MAAAKAKKTEDQIRREIVEWRDLAEEFTDNQEDLLIIAKTERDGKHPPKKDPHADRKALLLQVDDLYMEGEDEYDDDNELIKKSRKKPRTELAAWRALGKAVLANVDEDDPGWCETGFEKLNNVRELLGIPTVEEYTLTIPVSQSVKLADLEPDDLRVTITDANGKVIVKGARVVGIHEN